MTVVSECKCGCLFIGWGWTEGRTIIPGVRGEQEGCLPIFLLPACQVDLKVRREDLVLYEGAECCLFIKSEVKVNHRASCCFPVWVWGEQRGRTVGAYLWVGLGERVLIRRGVCLWWWRCCFCLNSSSEEKMVWHHGEEREPCGADWVRVDGRLMADRKSPALGGSVDTKGDVYTTVS